MSRKRPKPSADMFKDTPEVRAKHARRHAQDAKDLGHPVGYIGPRWTAPSIGDCIHCGGPISSLSSPAALEYGICDDCIMRD